MGIEHLLFERGRGGRGWACINDWAVHMRRWEGSCKHEKVGGSGACSTSEIGSREVCRERKT